MGLASALSAADVHRDGPFCEAHRAGVETARDPVKDAHRSPVLGGWSEPARGDACFRAAGSLAQRMRYGRDGDEAERGAVAETGAVTEMGAVAARGGLAERDDEAG